MSPSCINPCIVCPIKKLIENHCKPKERGGESETLLQSELAHIVIDIHINTKRAVFPAYDSVCVCVL
jgi:hypothetical protein